MKYLDLKKDFPIYFFHFKVIKRIEFGEEEEGEEEEEEERSEEEDILIKKESIKSNKILPQLLHFH